MEKELRIIIPTILILLAGFLAVYQDQERFESPRKESQPLTGFSVVDDADCSDADVVFRLTAVENAHAGTFDASQTKLPLVACFPGTSGSRQCTGTNTVLRLSSSENAHAETKDFANYPIDVCFSDLECVTADTGLCDARLAGSTCLVSLSSETNAHVGECGFYPLDLCCKSGSGAGPSLDTDSDGVLDDGGSSACDTGQTSGCDDNCPTRPNGPVLGTCMDDRSLTCIADTDCPTGVCNINQEDTDDDGVGNVCDDAYNDACTAGDGDGILESGESGDLCGGGFIDCGAITAQWDDTSETEGQSVTLTVTGSNMCEGATFLFDVFEESDNSIATIDPQPATMTGGIATGTWIAEFHADADDNVYLFQASAVINGNTIQVSSINSLQVSASASAACGNGLLEGSQNEECDDGNSKNFDGCSANCTLEGIFGPECSNDCAVPTLGVCTSSGQLSYCGSFDSDPCYDLSTPQSCPGSTICSDSTGDAICMPPTCEDKFQCTISECTGGFKTRSCTNIGSTTCDSYTPQEKIPCIRIEEPTNIPIFSMMNVLIVILLLGIVYGIKIKRL